MLTFTKDGMTKYVSDESILIEILINNGWKTEDMALETEEGELSAPLGKKRGRKPKA